MQAMDARDWPRARSLAAEVLAASPSSYEARQIRALAALHGGDANDALPHAEALVVRFPADAFAHNTLGAVLHALGRDERAARAFGKSAALAPQHPVAWINLARLHEAAGRHAEAAECLGKVVALGNADAQTYESLAWAHIRADRIDAALQPAREAARRGPQSVEAAKAAAHCELEVGDIDAAVAALQRLESIAPPAARWRFLRSLAWPPVMKSREQIVQRLAQVDAALDELIARPAPIADPLREVGLTGFYMAYHGFDDTVLQKKISHAYRLATPSLEWTAPHVARERPKGARIRVGIVSGHLNNHTIGKLNIGIAQKLDRRRFDLVVMRPPCAPDFLSTAFDEAAGVSVTLPFDLAAARAKVAEAALDAIFYPDIGMEPFTYYLAFARLARVQFTTLGHPVTTAKPNMDYFVSSRHAEPADAQRFYTERLALIDSWPAFFYRPRDPSSFEVRAALGLGANERIYLCAQTLYKIHPDFDRAVVAILRRDRDARIVLIGARREGWNEKMRARLALEGPDVAARVLFLPQLTLPDFLAALKGADALLDTFHFGGGLSSYESFAMSAPVVTLPGERMRSRLTLALYAHMGVSRWVAASADDFVDRALTLAHADARQRDAWRSEIADGAARFLENETVVRELDDFIEAAVNGSMAREQ
jgi:protein O-GlcNAc transferase